MVGWIRTDTWQPRPAASSMQGKMEGCAMLLARDIMTEKFITVPIAMTIGDLADLLQRAHIHAAPVLDPEGALAGIVTQEDVLYGTMGGDDNGDPPVRIQSRSGLLELDELDTLTPDASNLWTRPVSHIMTNPAMSVEKETSVVEVCRLMWSLRIHHLPVVEDHVVVGMISSLDLCRAIAEGKISP